MTSKPARDKPVTECAISHPSSRKTAKMSASAIRTSRFFTNRSHERLPMNPQRPIHCANAKCQAECGCDQAGTYSEPGYAELNAAVVIDDNTGDVYCSQECFDERHPAYCAECGDEQVGKVGDRCTYCTIAAEQGEEAANLWYRSQHPQLFRKPVVSVPASTPGVIQRMRVV